ncbi:MAG: response regulator transcription factor [Eubacterium sp.]|nr:response regulator transcription factor [Eubacterium sp.]
MIRILVVEDEKPISDLIRLNLRKEGYDCEAVYNGLDAIARVDSEHFDLVLLDVMLPGADGFEVMDYIKPLQIPVIFITARATIDDRLHGLTSGAEDYMIKPFDPLELIARVNIVLRRYDKTEKILTLGDLTVNTESNEVTKAGEEIRLTPKEYEMLVLFLRNKNITLYRDRIYEEVWGGDSDAETRTVDLHVQRIRKKAGLKNSLVTVYNMGYKIVER